MTSINTDYNQAQQADTSSLAALQNQISNLQRQCADWQSCPTTPTSEKEKIVSALSQQIQSLQSRVEQARTVDPANPVDKLDLENRNQSIPADGVNRPSKDPFAISGSVVNTSV